MRAVAEEACRRDTSFVLRSSRDDDDDDDDDDSEDSEDSEEEGGEESFVPGREHTSSSLPSSTITRPYRITRHVSVKSPSAPPRDLPKPRATSRRSVDEETTAGAPPLPLVGVGVVDVAVVSEEFNKDESESGRRNNAVNRYDMDEIKSESRSR